MVEVMNLIMVTLVVLMIVVVMDMMENKVLVLILILAVVMTMLVVVMAVGGSGGVGLIRIPTSFICSHATGIHKIRAASYITTKTCYTGLALFFLSLFSFFF